MKKLFFLSLLLGFVAFNSFKSDFDNPANSFTVDNSKSEIYDENIVNHFQTQSAGIVETFKVPDNEYIVYDGLNGRNSSDTIQVKTSDSTILNVRLFFNHRYKKNVYEIEDFNTKKEYAYCYDVEDFNKLIIEGDAQHISVVVRTGEYLHINNEDIEIKGNKVYTAKDFDIAEGTIIIMQGEIIIFEAEITSYGCS